MFHRILFFWAMRLLHMADKIFGARVPGAATSPGVGARWAGKARAQAPYRALLIMDRVCGDVDA